MYTYCLTSTITSATYSEESFVFIVGKAGQQHTVHLFNCMSSLWPRVIVLSLCLFRHLYNLKQKRV